MIILETNHRRKHGHGDLKQKSFKKSTEQTDGNDDIQPILSRNPMLHLAKNQEFEEMLYILQSDNIDLRYWLDISRSNNRNKGDRNSPLLIQFSGQSILHLILYYHPPSIIIDLIIKKMKQYNQLPTLAENFVDIKGRTPLHVALSVGCSVPIIECLLLHLYFSASVKDFMSRYPLHWACCCPAHSNQTDHTSKTVPKSTLRTVKKKSCSLCAFGTNRALSSSSSFSSSTNTATTSVDEKVNDLIRIIEILLNANPSAITASDLHGMKPIDLAIEHKLPIEVQHLLTEAEQQMGDRYDPAESSTRTSHMVETVSQQTAPVTTIEFQITYKKRHYDIDVPALIVTKHEDDVSTLASGGISQVISTQSAGTSTAENSSQSNKENKIDEK